MDRRTIAVLIVGVLVVLAGCTGASPPGEQTIDNAGDGPTVTEPTAKTPTATTNAPGETTDVQTSPPSGGTLEIHYINVGQASSTLVIAPSGETMLIDTGDYTDDGAFVLDYLKAHNITRIDYLKAHNITRIDYLVTSHADADHIGGHAAVIEYYETQANGIGAVYDPGIAAPSETYEEYLNAVEQYNVPLYETHTGDRIPLDGVAVRVLAPPEPYLAGGERNENSIVLQVTFGRASFLLPGDIEDDGEQFLLDRYGKHLQSTVLQVPHHGSRTSSSAAFLTAVDPRIAVISSAFDSEYGHPHEEVLQRLAERNISTYWTAVHGNIVLVTNGSTLTIKTQRAATTNPLELREELPIAPSVDVPPEQRATITLSPSEQPTETTTSTTDDGTTTTATPASPASLAVAEVHADAAGNDNENPNDEYVVFENTDSETLDLSGWTVEDEVGHSYTFPSGTTLAPGETLTLHTGSGTNTASDVYWGASGAIWNNGGDTIIVTTDDGERVLEESYS